MTNKLPKNWDIVRINDIADFIRGVSYKKEKARNVPKKEYIPIIRANNIQEQIMYEDLVYVPQSCVKAEQLLKNKDIVFAMSSGSKHLVGKAAKITPPMRISFGTFCGAIRIKKEFNSDFVSYFFQTKEYRDYVSKISQGVNINNLKTAHIINIQLPFPSFNEQKRIVSTIEKFFKKIDDSVSQLHAAQNQICAFREAILGLYFNTDKNRVNLESVCDYIQRGKSPQYTTTSSLPVINQKCIRWSCLQQEYLKYIAPSQFKDWSGERFVKEGDILWNSTGTGTIGRAYMLRKSDLKTKMVVDSHVTIVRASQKQLLPQYAFYFIMSPYIQKKIEKMQAGSTNQVELNRSIICKTLIPIIPIEEQKSVVTEIEKQFAVADKMQQAVDTALEQAKQLKQAILKKAFAGKLVPQDPSDEPAALLLEKIKAERNAAVHNYKLFKRKTK